MPNLGFEGARVALAGATLEISCRLVNRSAATWTGTDGWAAGYHLFDDPTGVLVVDGERMALNLQPGESSEFAISIATPPEPGEYSVYISAMRENEAWFYERGWTFLLIELVVGDDGVPMLRNWRPATIRSIRAKRLARSFGRAFTMPFTSVWRNRNLVRTMVRRDVMGRYTGSFGGAFWAVLNPLLLMMTYFFVFGIVMETKFKNDPSKTGFALYFLAGMLPWLPFSEAVGRAPFVLLEHRNFIKKLVFPVETLPVNLVVSGLVTEFFGLILFLLALFCIRGSVPATALYVPLVLIPQILLTAGLAWFLSALGAFARDLGQIIGYMLTVLMFLTPIFYPEEQLPKFAAGVIRANPIYVLVHAYRAVLLESHAPDWRALGWLMLASMALFVLGHAWFHKLRKSFADLI